MWDKGGGPCLYLLHEPLQGTHPNICDGQGEHFSMSFSPNVTLREVLS